MNTREIKELANMAVNQCRDRLIELIKNCGVIDTNIKTYRLFENDNDVPTYETCVIIKIGDGNVYYADNVYDELEVLSMDELYNIVSNL